MNDPETAAVLKLDNSKPLATLRELRKYLPPKPGDVEKCLQMIAEVRAWIPERDRSPVPLVKREEGRLPFTPTSTFEFDCNVILEEVELLLAEFHFAQASHVMRAVQAYWSIEDDPVQLEQYKEDIEALHQNYRKIFGKPLPKNPKKK